MLVLYCQEWVWPIGYFLRAKLLFAKKLESERPGILKETVLFIRSTLTRHYEEVMKSSWRSLPEITNHNAEVAHLFIALPIFTMV
jgi:glycogen debranching enzyme